MAKRDFSVRSEVRCDEAGTMCYDARSGAPFRASCGCIIPTERFRRPFFMPTDGRTANTASFLRTEVCVIPAFIRTGNRKAC